MSATGLPLSRDADLRELVHAQLQAEHGVDQHTFVVDEFGLCRGQARIDIAVVNGSLSGYELKSGSDDLRRLPTQIRHYNRVFDFVTLVVDSTHLDEVLGECPAWYGIKVVRSRGELAEVRRPRGNPESCARSICQLLWRVEMLQILELHGHSRGLHRKPRRDLVAKICREFDSRTLADLVRGQLRRRYAAMAA